MNSDQKRENARTWIAEDLDVFKRGYALSLDLHRLSLAFPKIERYAGLGDQLRRSSKSVCAMIVEGYGRQSGSPKEFARYLQMAVGSAEEARLWCRYASDLGYVETTQAQAQAWREDYGRVIRMLQALKAKLEASI